MKTRIILACTTIALTISMANAQITTTSTTYTTKYDGGDDPEYVTVGSIMPYKITPFNWGSLTPFMNPSIFKWWMNGNATGYNLLKSDGIAPLASLPPPNNVYYPDSVISINWIKTGNYTIRVHEKSMPKAGITGCDQPGEFQTQDVVVADRPSVTWDGLTTRGGCGLDNTTQDVPVIVTGSKLITVTYDLVYYPLTGNPVTTPDVTANFNTTKNSSSTSGNIQITIPKSQFGRYEVIIKGVTDSVAKKCGATSQPSDYPSDKYTLVVLPVLETSPIKYVNDL